MSKTCLGIIPARGGSKGVLRKNIRLVAGKPLIAYSIEAAKASRRLTRFVTSTDDEEIAAVARSLGCEVVMRPPELAGDTTPMLPVLQHVLQTLAERGEQFDILVTLQPTAPMRTGADIDAALDLLIETGCDSVVSVYQVGDAHPSRMYTLKDELLVPYEKEDPRRLRQMLPAVYHRNGAIYACWKRLLLEQGTLIGPKTRPYIMPRERSINIDDELDLAFADWMLRRQAEGG